MSKETVSASYMEAQKAKHLSKPHNQPCILITGDGKPGSIGQAIRHHRKGIGNEILSFIGDVRSTKDIRNSLVSLSFNTLICCHGTNHLDWIEDQPQDKIEEQVSVNLTGTIQIISEFVRRTIDNGERKTIIVIGSMGGKAVLNGSSPYCAAKAGVEHFCRCIAWELAPKGYDVFLINPSNVEGAPMSEATIEGLARYRNMSKEEARKYWGAVCPKERFMNVNDITAVVDFLLSGKAEYLSGSAIDMKGGQR